MQELRKLSNFELCELNELINGVKDVIEKHYNVSDFLSLGFKNSLDSFDANLEREFARREL